MNRQLDPNLASILDSIRATVGGEEPAATGGAEPSAAADSSSAGGAVAAAPARLPPPSDRSVEAFLADLIRPQVAAWLEQHLPEIIQKLAAEEIARLTGKP